MQVNLHDAKTHLSRYVDRALDGEEVVIARAGKALVRLVPVEEPSTARRLGFLRDQADVHLDLKGNFSSDIAQMFEG